MLTESHRKREREYHKQSSLYLEKLCHQDGPYFRWLANKT